MGKKVNKKRLKAAGICALVLVGALAVIGVFELIVGGIGGSLDFLGAGERWSADGSPYAVIAAYMEDGCGTDENTVIGWEMSMESALTEAAVSSIGGRRWAYAASFDTTLSLYGPKGSVTAEVTVCKGDFFTFHSFDYVCGSGFRDDPSNPMGVVLDELLAWKLFGATNIVGMTFTSGEEEYTVVGVCRPESKHGAYAYTYGERPRMYMSYAGYSKIGDGVFTVYETALPDPVNSFGKNIFDTVVSPNTDMSDVIEATDRFSLENRFSNMKKLGYSWISINKLEYPYWENEARVYDYRCAVMMIFEIISAGIGAAALIASLVLVVISGYSPVTTVKNIFSKAATRRKKNKRKKIITKEV